jgi:hypothetical protein
LLPASTLSGAAATPPAEGAEYFGGDP